MNHAVPGDTILLVQALERIQSGESPQAVLLEVIESGFSRNERLVYNHVREKGPTTSAYTSAATAISAGDCSELLARLWRFGVLTRSSGDANKPLKQPYWYQIRWKSEGGP
jgi:hypothetical protein